MRINEDYLDNIDIDQETSIHVSADKRTNDKFERMFEFKASEMPKHRKQEWYIERIVHFHKKFTDMLDRLPFIQDYNENFSINLGVSGVTNTYIEMEGDYGFDICHPLYRDSDYDITSNSNMPWFEIGMNVRLETLEQLRRLLVNLWKCFEMCYTEAFGKFSSAKSIYYHNPETQKFYIFIDLQNYYTWKERSEKAEGLFINELRCLYPDKKPRELKPEVQRFIERGKSDVSEMVNRWRTQQYDYYDDKVIRQSDKILVENGTLVFHRTKPLELSQQYIRVMNHKSVPFVIEDLRKIIFIPFLSLYSKPEDYFAELKDWIDKYAPNVNEIEVCVDGDSLFPYAGKTVDLQTMFRGRRTSVKMRQKELKTYYTSTPNQYDGGKCYVPKKNFKVTFITSEEGKQKFEVKVISLGKH